jgi:SAM-dependent methyltransferase
MPASTDVDNELENKPSQMQKDFLWLHIRELPYFRALLRAVEARFYQDISLPQPTLDVGCGDGHFASAAFERTLDVGLDPWHAPIREAAHRIGYRSLVQADGGHMPFPDHCFGSAISNSVLEHIPNIEAVLSETARVLKTGAPFYFCVPNQNFNPNLAVAKTLDKFGLKDLGNTYRKFFDRIARHIHLDPPRVWSNRLEDAGFKIQSFWNYYSPEAQRITELGHFFGLPSLVSQKITGKWILVPTRWNLALTDKLTRKYYDEDPRCADGVCTFYIAQRN